MELKKVVVDLHQIDLLEQRVIKATEMIRSLRRERDAACIRHQEAQEALARLQSEHQNLVRSGEDSRELTEQLEVLREERQTVRGKVTRMLEMMATLEDHPAGARGDH